MKSRSRDGLAAKGLLSFDTQHEYLSQTVVSQGTPLNPKGFLVQCFLD